MVTRHLNEIELSRRWAISPKTLQRWRWLKNGPKYLKIGGRILYREEDVQAFESAHTYLAGDVGSSADR
jgi:hypothetical protein